MIRHVITAFAILALPAVGLAGEPAKPAHGDANIARAEMASLVKGHARPGQRLDEIRTRILAVFDAADIDGGGISASDEELRQAETAAELRARRVSAVLMHDLDGDGAVTVAEARRSLVPQARKPLRSSAGKVAPTPEQIAQTLDELVRKLNLPDVDGDGRATLAEIFAAAKAEQAARKRRPHYLRQRRISSAFDLDGDGTVTRDEFIAVLDPALATIDADGDGTVSADEAKAFRAVVAAAKQRVARRRALEKHADQLRARAAACPIPKVPDDALLIYLGVFKGEVISPVLLASTRGVTYLADIDIEPGKRPIYLMLGMRTRMIVRFHGAVERLAHVVSLGTNDMGFVGIDRSRVAWLQDEPCRLRGWNPRADRGGTVFERGYVDALAGRPIDKVGSRLTIGAMALPSGKVIEREQIPGQPVRREGLSGVIFKSAPAPGGWQHPEVTPETVLAPPGVATLAMPQ